MWRNSLLLGAAFVAVVVKAFPEGGILFSPLFSKLCVEVDGEPGGAPGEKVHQWDCPTRKVRRDRVFRFEKVGSAYRIRPDSNRRCLGMKDKSTVNAVAVVTQECVDEPHQLWKVTKEGGIVLTAAEEIKSPEDRRADGNYFEIRAMHTDKCMSILGNDKSKGAKIVQFPCKASGKNLDQLWDVQGQLGYTSLESYVVGQKGIWSDIITMPLVAAAAANLPDGSILAWASAFKDDFGGGSSPSQTITAIYNPETMKSSSMTIQHTNHDMLCAGTSVLFDGHVVITGGSTPEKMTIYDPKTNTWSVGPELNRPRGCHAQTVLPDGSVFLLGGSHNRVIGGKYGEVWDPNTNVWTGRTNIQANGDLVTNDRRGLFRADNHMWLYIAPNGLIFHAGPSKQMHWMDVWSTPGGSVMPAGQRSSTDRMNGCSVMYDIGKILTFGGAVDYSDSPATTEAFVIDLNKGTDVTVTQTASLHFPRVSGNAVVLPNGHVLAIGGQSHSVPYFDDLTQYRTEMWKPETGEWELLENAKVPRNYRSVALLMKNGKVWSAGGGLCGKCPSNHLDAQVFTPPYLVDNVTGMPKVQPIILEAPTVIRAGSIFQIKMDTSAVHTFALCRLGAVTHGVDNDARRIPLTVASQSGQFTTLSVPDSIYVSLTGSYHLFGMNPDGVPSIGHVLHLGPPQRPTPGPSTAASVQSPLATPFSPLSVVNINAGGKSDKVGGKAWDSDDGYVSGAGCKVGNFDGTQTFGIPSDAQFLHQKERWGPCTFTMNNLDTGAFTVIMHFAEFHESNKAVGARVFDIDVETDQVKIVSFENVDIFAAVGGNSVYYLTADVFVTAGQSLIVKLKKGASNNPKISALEVVPLLDRLAVELPSPCHLERVSLCPCLAATND